MAPLAGWCPKFRWFLVGGAGDTSNIPSPMWTVDFACVCHVSGRRDITACVASCKPTYNPIDRLSSPLNHCGCSHYPLSTRIWIRNSPGSSQKLGMECMCGGLQTLVLLPPMGAKGTCVRSRPACRHNATSRPGTSCKRLVRNRLSEIEGEPFTEPHANMNRGD